MKNNRIIANIKFKKIRFIKILFLTILIILFLNLIQTSGFSQQVVVKFYIFSSPECEYCEELENEYLPKMFEKYEEKIEVKILNVLNEEEYLLWNRFSEKLNYSNPLLPTVVIDNVMLSGLDEIEARLEVEIDRSLKEGGCEFPELYEVTEETYSPGCKKCDDKETTDTTEKTTEETVEEITEATEADKKLYITYFYRVGCKECDSVYYLLNYLKNKYTNLVVKQYDISDSSNIKLFESLCKRNKVEKKDWLKAPTIFIGDDYLIGENINKNNSEKLVRKYLLTGTDSPEQLAQDYIKKAHQDLIERFKRFNVFPILLAGLIDGINPCAFATLIFFISYLVYIGRSKREIIYVGISFNFAVFLAYLFIGAGFLKIIINLAAFSIISKIVYIITACIALILGILNFVDFFRIREGHTDKMILQIPMFLKREIHKTIRYRSRKGLYFISSFLIGLVISILEFACTGQIYLPTIVYVSTIPNLRFRAYLYLILYNLMFILPLIIIFILYYIGATSKKIEYAIKGNVYKVKLITGIFFLTLSVFLIINII
jgi:cytochrome c biogenesis protein CcdA